MQSLRMLGRIDLTGSDGAEVDAVLRQPKSVALLAYDAGSLSGAGARPHVALTEVSRLRTIFGGLHIASAAACVRSVRSRSSLAARTCVMRLPNLTTSEVHSVAVACGDPQRVWRLAIAIALLALASACRSDSEPTKPRIAENAVAIVLLTSDACDVALGGTISISARATDQSGMPVPLPGLEWRSESPAIASVDQAGVVHGVAPGTSVISATAGTLTASIEVAVDVASGPLSISGPGVVLSASTLQLGLMAQRGQCRARVSATSWTSSDSTIAFVDATGRVTGRRAGTFTVSATRLDVTASRTVAVAATLGRIAFLNGGFLSVMSVGGEPTRVVSGDGEYVNTTSAAMSPDGRWLAFDCLTGVCRIASNGGGTPTTMINVGTSPSWSESSLLVAARLGYAELGILDVETGRVDRMPTVRYAQRPRLSPDGTEIAYECDYTNQYDELSDVCIQSTVRRTLVAVIQRASALAWSPDGTRLAYARDDGLCVAPRNNPASCTTVIARTRDDGAIEAAWSPDGSMLVVARWDGLWIASPEGENPTPLLVSEKAAGSISSPSWSLDP